LKMAYIDDLNAELARLQKLPTNSSVQAIQRVQQQILAEQKRLNQPAQDISDIDNTFGSPASLPAVTDTGNYSLMAFQKRAQQKQSALNEFDFSSSALQSTGNTTLASIYGAVVVGNQMAANIYGYVQRPSQSVVVSQISEASLATLMTSTNTYLGSSPNQFYSTQMIIDSLGTDYIMVITEFNPPV